jgi:hypothetical protein
MRAGLSMGDVEQPSPSKPVAKIGKHKSTERDDGTVQPNIG